MVLVFAIAAYNEKMFELKKIGKHWLIRPTGGQFSQLDIPIGAKHVEITDNFLVIDEQVYEIKASGNIAYVEKLPVISLTEEKHEPRNECSGASAIQPVSVKLKDKSNVGLRRYSKENMFDVEENCEMLSTSKTNNTSEKIETEKGCAASIQTLKNKESYQPLTDDYERNLFTSLHQTHVNAFYSVPSEILTSHQESITSHAESEKSFVRNISTGIEDAQTEYDSLEASQTEETSEIEIIQEKKKDTEANPFGNRKWSSQSSFKENGSKDEEEKQDQGDGIRVAEEDSFLHLTRSVSSGNSADCEQAVARKTAKSLNVKPIPGESETASVRHKQSVLLKQNGELISEENVDLAVTEYMKCQFVLNNHDEFLKISDEFMVSFNAKVTTYENKLVITFQNEDEAERSTEDIKAYVYFILEKMTHISVSYVKTGNIDHISIIEKARQSELCLSNKVFFYYRNVDHRVYLSYNGLIREEIKILAKALLETPQLTMPYFFIHLLDKEDTKTVMLELFPGVEFIISLAPDRNYAKVTFKGDPVKSQQCKNWCEKDLIEKYAIATIEKYSEKEPHSGSWFELLSEFLNHFLKDKSIYFFADTEVSRVWLYGEVPQGEIDSVKTKIQACLYKGLVKEELALSSDEQKQDVVSYIGKEFSTLKIKLDERQLCIIGSSTEVLRAKKAVIEKIQSWQEAQIVHRIEQDKDDEGCNNLPKGASGDSLLQSSFNAGKEEQANKPTAEVKAAKVDLSQDTPANRLDSVPCEKTMEHNYQQRGKSFDDLWKNNRHVCWRFPRENQLIVGEIDPSCLHHEPVIFLTEQDSPHDKIIDYQKSPLRLAFSIHVPIIKWGKHKYELVDNMRRALQTIEGSGAFDILVVVKFEHNSATLKVILYQIFEWLKYKSRFGATVFFGCSTASIYKMLTELILEAGPSTDVTVNDASKQEKTDTDPWTNSRQEPQMYKYKQVQKVSQDYQHKSSYSSGQKYFGEDLDMPIQRKESNEQSMESEFDAVREPVRVPLPAEIVLQFIKSKYKADFLEYEQVYGTISFQAGDVVIPYMEEKRCREFVNKFKMYSKSIDIFEIDVATEHVNTFKEWCEELNKNGKFCQLDLKTMQFYICCESYDDLLRCKHLYQIKTFQLINTVKRSRRTSVYSNDLENANLANEKKTPKD